MKIIMFYALEFAWKPFKPVLSEVETHPQPHLCPKALVIFYQVEGKDEERKEKVLKKLVKNIKWLARKWKTEKIVFHSFSHLSPDKSSPTLAQEIITQATERLQRVGFEIFHTPYGWLNEWKIHVAGESLAKVFKDL